MKAGRRLRSCSILEVYNSEGPEGTSGLEAQTWSLAGLGQLNSKV